MEVTRQKDDSSAEQSTEHLHLEKTQAKNKPSGFNVITQTKYGPMLVNRFDRYIGRSLITYGEYSDGEVQLFQRLLKPGDRVIEVGANIGSHTLPLAKIVGEKGRVFAFEPQRVVFQTLCANMAINSLTNVETYHIAVGEKYGWRVLPDIDYKRRGDFGGFSLEECYLGRPLPQTTLDDFPPLQLQEIKMIKIDVECMELKVLQGAEQLIRQQKPMLYVENDRKDKSQALMQWIESMGYQIKLHQPPLYQQSNFKQCKENVFGEIVSKNIICWPE